LGTERGRFTRFAAAVDLGDHESARKGRLVLFASLICFLCRVQTNHPLTGAPGAEHSGIRVFLNPPALRRKEQELGSAVSAPDPREPVMSENQISLKTRDIFRKLVSQ
jgi:hypothetical protein